MPAPSAAVVAAKTAVVAKYHFHKLSSVTSYRSRRNPRYALVDGYYSKTGLWAVWLKLRDGKWRVLYVGKDAKAVQPNVFVPCDVVPAFSEPSC